MGIFIDSIKFSAGIKEQITCEIHLRLVQLPCIHSEINQYDTKHRHYYVSPERLRGYELLPKQQ